MAVADCGTWQPLDIPTLIDTFRSAPFRWWVSGGRALELHLQRSWRPHEDIDVGVVREDLSLLQDHLAFLEVHVASAGTLLAWQGEELSSARHQNNLWCRRGPGQAWIFDVAIGEGSPTEWIYRRDAALHRPWHAAVLETADGIPYLAPELQLLFKSTTLRPKDDLDAAEVIPQLDAEQRSFLTNCLHSDHPWTALLRASGTR
jgi:hypothetical protein